MRDGSGTLDIGEVAARSGLAPSALRYYEKQGLVRSAERKGLRRQYDSSVLLWLAFIRLCQEAGFTIPEIGQFLRERSKSRSRWRSVVKEKLASIEDQLHRLSLAREMLTHAKECESPDIVDCPHFQRTLSAYADRLS